MSITDVVKKFVDAELEKRLGEYFEPEDLEKRQKEDGHGRKGLIFDPFTDQGYSSGIWRNKGAGSGFLSNQILKMVSRRDPIVSTILHTRGSQVSAFCRIPTDRFDTGFAVVPRDKSQASGEEIREIERFILNCGSLEERSKEDLLQFDQFGYMITQDMLTYGHSAIEKVRDRTGALHSFLTLPAETIYLATKKADPKLVENMVQAHREAYAHASGEKFDDTPQDGSPSFVQVVHGKVVESFTHEDLIMARIYLQSDIDLNGYALSPLERAISMITAHLQIENHQKQFFTHGVASRGLLVVQGDVTPNQLRTLQAQWTAQVTGPQTAWRTPILAGINGVQWVPLTVSNRDMEFAAYQDHVLRVLHASFSIDAEETGFGYLSRGQEQRSLSESSNEWKLTASRDKGLRPILGRIESIINEEILPNWRPEYAQKYKFVFVGIDAETRQEEIARLQSEVQLHTTIGEVRNEAALPPLEYGSQLILNPLYLDVIQRNMTKGEFMERFIGVEGASQRPDLQYIPDPMWFQWQQNMLQMMQMQSGGGEPDSEEPESKDKDKETKKNESAAQAVDMFISANPELFKSLSANLKKTDFVDHHVDEMKGRLTKDFDRASKFLITEVLKAVEEEIKDSVKKDSK